MRKGLIRITLTGSGTIWTDFLKCFGTRRPYPGRVLALGKLCKLPGNPADYNYHCEYFVLAIKDLEDGPARATLVKGHAVRRPDGTLPGGLAWSLTCPTPSDDDVEIPLPKGFRASAPIYDARNNFTVVWSDVHNRPKRKKANTRDEAHAGLLEF